MPLDGFAIPGGGGDVVDSQYVGGTLITEEGDGALGVSASDPSDIIAFADTDFFDVAEALLTFDPSVSRHDHIGLF